MVLAAPGGERWRAAILCSRFASRSSSQSSQRRALPEAGEYANGQEQGCQGCGVAAGVKHLHGDKVAFLEGKAPNE